MSWCLRIIGTLVCLLFILVGCGSNDTSSTAGASPTIASIAPASAPVGTTVIITGTNFSTTPANNAVSFNGTAAVVTSCTSTQIVTIVPASATDGPITVTVGSNHASSVISFTVTILIGGSIQGHPTSPAGVVSTLAGTVGTMGSADGIGTAASFTNPLGITTDGTNLYVVDAANHTIRQIVITTGVVSTLAGTAGTTGSADGTGPAASFNNIPWGITTDGANLYVTDNGGTLANGTITYTSSTIRKIVIATGAVSTLAGTAETTGSADGIGANASFYHTLGITTDGTNLYVADSNNTIRQIVIATGAVTTLAGSAGTTGSADGIGANASFWGPAAITTDGTYLYVVDRGNCTIRKIEIATKVVTTIAGSPSPFPHGWADGVGTAASFSNPLGITTDGTNLYVADSWNNTIRKIVISTSVVSTLAGTAGTTGSTDGTGSAALFNHPTNMTTDGTNLYVTDSGNMTIRKIQ